MSRPASRAANTRVRMNYRVRSGDTLARIADRYDTTVGQLMAWNKGLRPTRLAAGNVLTVYARKATDRLVLCGPGTARTAHWRLPPLRGSPPTPGRTCFGRSS